MLHGQRLAGWNENSFSIGLVSIGESVHQQWTQEVIILTFVSIDAFQLCLVCFPWRLLRLFLHHICLVCFWLWTLKDFALFFQGVGEARMSLDLASLFLRVGWNENRIQNGIWIPNRTTVLVILLLIFGPTAWCTPCCIVFDHSMRSCNQAPRILLFFDKKAIKAPPKSG